MEYIFYSMYFRPLPVLSEFFEDDFVQHNILALQYKGPYIIG